MEANLSLDVEVSDNDIVDVPYRTALGSLLYVMVVTCSDIAFEICRLAKYVECPAKIY